MKEKPVKGQTLYSLNVGNAARYDKEGVLTPVIVTKVGRKYFTCKRVDRLDVDWEDGNQYHIDTWWQKVDCSATSLLYESEQAYLDSKEIISICKYIEAEFDYGKSKSDIPLAALRTIKRIMENN